MATQLDLSRYVHLSRESFTTVTPSPVTTLDPSFLVYSSDLSIILCSVCREALSGKTSVTKHLSNPPHRQYWQDLEKSDRASILSALHSQALVAYHHLPRIPPNLYYFEQLPVIFDTYKCPDCPYFTLDGKKAREHRIHIHKIRWEATTKRTDILYNLPAQVLFPRGGRGLFIPKLPSLISYPAEVALSVPERQQPSTSSTLEPTISTTDSSAMDLLTPYLEKEELAVAKMSSSKNLTSKNKNAFLRNSRFDIFGLDKNVPLLMELVSPINSETPSQWSILHTIATKMQSKISDLIPHLIRPVRLELKEEELNTLATFTKDFIELEPSTRRTYFAIFGDLFVFLLRLLEYKELEEQDGNFDYIQKVKLSTDLTQHLYELRDVFQELSVEIFEDGMEDSLFNIEALLAEIVMDLLRIEIRFETMLEYTTFRNPMILFFTLQSINQRDSSFKSDQVISKLTSKLIYGSRLWFLGSIWTNEVKNSSIPDSSFDMEDYYHSNIDRLTINRGHNYFEEVARTRRYLIKALKDRVSDNKTIIEIGPDTYLVYEKKYTFLGICELHQRLEQQLRELLFNRLILLPRRELPRLNLLELDDNSTISTEGYYLADNPSFLSTKSFIQQHLVTSTSSIYRSLLKRIESDGTKRWRKTFIAEFLQARQTFIKLFLAAAHLASGSPLRGTEWEHTTFRNLRGTDSNIRDVIWDRHQGQIRITTHWYKSRNLARQSRPNIRFLPPNLSYMLVDYILYVIPVYYYISLEYLELDELSPFLFEVNGDQIRSSTLSRQLYVQSGLIFRSGLTVNPYRHLVNHILLDKIGPEAAEFIDSTDENIDPAIEQIDSIIDEQANRSSKTGQLHYSLLANHSTGGQRGKYRKVVDFTHKYQELFKIEKLDQEYLNFEPLLEETEASSTSAEGQRVLSYYSRENIVPTVDIFYQLGQLFRDKNAQFRDSFQREAVFAIFESITYLTYINKTGSGKSLLYLLPAFTRYQHIVNIVITPRVSLRDDLFQRAQDRKIRTVRFEDLVSEIDEEHTYQPFNLVLASVESIEHSTFSEYVIQLVESYRPVRIYIDEVHTIILEKNFRYIMKYVNNLLQYKVPLVFISATLPIPLLRLVENEFFLQPGLNRIIRSNSIREDIEYRIVNVEGEIRPQTIKSVVKRCQQRGLGPKAKAIVFVSNTTEGKDLSIKLNYPFYYASNPQKKEILDSFLTDDTVLVILATSALSLGVDFNVVKFTLHVPPHYGLVEFIQGSSRIRKDGYAVILQSKRTEATKNKTRTLYESIDLSRITTLEEFRSVDRLIFQKLLNEDRCLRQIISHFLDNVDIVSCTAWNMRTASKIRSCSLCRKQQEILDQQAAQEEKSVRVSNVSLADFEETVEKFGRTQCIFCLLLGNLDGYHTHSILSCSQSKSSSFYESYGMTKTLQDRLNAMSSRLAQNTGLAPGSCCFYCLLPKRVCLHLKELENKESGDECVYRELIRALIITIEIRLEIGSPGLFLSALGIDNIELRPRLGDTAGVLDYCRKPIQLYGTDAIQVCRVLNELSIGKIVQLRENLEDEGQRKRYRQST